MTPHYYGVLPLERLGMYGAAVKLFALKGSAAPDAFVATHLGLPIAAHGERECEDGERRRP